MRIFALTFGDADMPSTHFRIHQYRDAFRAQGVKIEHARARGFEDFSTLRDYDLVLLQKTLLSATKVKRIARHARALVYDADDRIWMRPGKPYGFFTRAKLEHRLRAIVSRAHLCLAANGVIAQDQRQAGAQRVEVLPMSVDTNQWNATGRAPENETLTIGWSGSPGNLAFLEPLVPALRRVMGAHSGVRVAIHCGKKPDFEGLDFTHYGFEPGREPESVRQFDIGLLPLPDDAFVHGKSPIKALQYFSCGVAVVGQDVGATAELLEHDVNALTVNDVRSWESNLARLVQSPDLRARLVRAGHAKIEREHRMEAVVERYLMLLRSVIQTPCES